jgi:phosphatidylserine decarboxylase
MVFNTFIQHSPEAIAVPLFCAASYMVTGNLQWLYASAIAASVFMGFYRGVPDEDLQIMNRNAQSPHVVLCPCDGTVLDVVSRDDGFTQIAVFLGLHNIHVQYFPIDGTIKSITHKPGTFHPAYMFVKSQYNERVETVLNTMIGEVCVVQIAGLVARRIVHFYAPGNIIQRLEPMGLIKFGSRVDIWVPNKSGMVLVSPGERVHVGTPLFTQLYTRKDLRVKTSRNV